MTSSLNNEDIKIVSIAINHKFNMIQVDLHFPPRYLPPFPPHNFVETHATPSQNTFVLFHFRTQLDYKERNIGTHFLYYVAKIYKSKHWESR